MGDLWGVNENFFSKIRLGHSFSLAKMQLSVKFEKNLMRGSPNIASRTNGRTAIFNAAGDFPCLS